jgi:hypothetical protein
MGCRTWPSEEIQGARQGRKLKPRLEEKPSRFGDRDARRVLVQWYEVR